MWGSQQRPRRVCCLSKSLPAASSGGTPGPRKSFARDVLLVVRSPRDLWWAAAEHCILPKGMEMLGVVTPCVSSGSWTGASACSPSMLRVSGTKSQMPHGAAALVSIRAASHCPVSAPSLLPLSRGCCFPGATAVGSSGPLWRVLLSLEFYNVLLCPAALDKPLTFLRRAREHFCVLREGQMRRNKPCPPAAMLRTCSQHPGGALPPSSPAPSCDVTADALGDLMVLLASTSPEG